MAAADISEAAILVAATASTVVVEVIWEVVDLIRGRFIPVRAFIRGRFIPLPAFTRDHFNNDWLTLRREPCRPLPVIRWPRGLS